MPELFIAGRWRDAADGRTRDIRCPADGRPVATVSEGGAEDATAAVVAARQAFDNGPWPTTPSPERAALLHRLADRLEAERDEVARAGVARHRQALRRAPARRRRHRRGLPPLRLARPGGRRSCGRRGHARCGQPGGARAGRRLRADHAVELPAAADRLEGRAGAGRGQHVRAQAERAHPVHGDLADDGARRGRAARRRRQPGARGRGPRRRGPDRGPGGRPGVVHRRHRHRPPDHGGGRRRP